MKTDEFRNVTRFHICQKIGAELENNTSLQKNTPTQVTKPREHILNHISFKYVFQVWAFQDSH